MIARVTALVALVAALVVAVASASGPLEPRGRLLFVRSDPPFALDPKRSIVELDLATGRERVVAALPHRFYPTAWSPDFRQVALVFLPPADRPSPGALYVLDLATKRVRRVLRTGASFATWSPDGRAIAVAARLRKRRGLVVVDPRGRKKPKMIVCCGDAAPSWSPDLCCGSATPTWSPDGSKIMFGWADDQIPYTCCGTIGIADRNGHSARYPIMGTGQGPSALWAPDSSRIAFSLYVLGPGGVRLYTLDGKQERILTNAADELWSWSPDGSTIALSRYRAGYGKPSQLVLVRLDGGEQTIASNTAYAAWSPDSEALVYSKTEPTGIHLYLARADGTATRQLTDGPVADGTPQWVP